MISYLVLAAPHIGLFKLLHVPSSERYGVLTHRCGGAVHRIVVTCFGYDGPGKKLLQKNI